MLDVIVGCYLEDVLLVSSGFIPYSFRIHKVPKVIRLKRLPVHTHWPSCLSMGRTIWDQTHVCRDFIVLANRKYRMVEVTNE